MGNNCLHLSALACQPQGKARFAQHAGKSYSYNQWQQMVSAWAEQWRQSPAQQFALYTEAAYPFAIALFALLHAGKQVLLPGNNRPGTAAELAETCQLVGDWPSQALAANMLLEPVLHASVVLSPLNPWTTQLQLFTSASTGQAKLIPKCLQQLQTEIEVLEQLWGAQLGQADAVSSVSHQHIYGLLFSVLWPLLTGRVMISERINQLEALMAPATLAAYWIASPAFLKRLTAENDVSGFQLIFSSGGVLPALTQTQLAGNGYRVVEVYGSSETGGIAWRQQQACWQLFPALRLVAEQQRWRLYSPYLAQAPTSQEGSCLLDDQLSEVGAGQFKLLGRLDRIVKIEEKRLSLTELEQRLKALPSVLDAYCWLLPGVRQRIAGAVVLSAQGLEQLATDGRWAFTQHLRQQLAAYFELSVLPKAWLWLNHLPQTANAKIDQSLLNGLLAVERTQLPQVQQLIWAEQQISLALYVPANLRYFPDHFAQYPLLPGVVQLAWASYFGELLFNITLPFSQLEAVKYMQVIQPDLSMELVLQWKPSTQKLYFTFSSTQGQHSSGRIVYGALL